jgi:hypothetical protein
MASVGHAHVVATTCDRRRQARRGIEASKCRGGAALRILNEKKIYTLPCRGILNEPAFIHNEKSKVLELRLTARVHPVTTGAPRRVTDSVGDVLGVRRGEPTGSKEPGAPPPAALSANVFQICSALEFLSSTWMGGVWTGRLDVTRSVGDHLETFCLPQPEATLRSQLESWRAGR